MSFLAPIWLIGLLPWTAVAVYLLLGRRPQHRVPFLELWLGPVKGPRPKRRIAAPPAAVVAALLAVLLALLAAAGPLLHSAAPPASPITVVIDRGATMSARAENVPRFVEAAAALAEELGKIGPSTSISLQVVPSGPRQAPTRVQPSDLVRVVSGVPRTAVDTTVAVNATVSQLARGSDPFIVITDRPLPATGALIQVPPQSTVLNVGIDRVAVRASPRPQVMVAVRNAKELPARPEVTSAGLTVTKNDVLSYGPPDDRGYTFLDLQALGDVIEVRLAADDAFEADNVAWLVREGNWPRIEPRAPLPAELARMVDVYKWSRPASEASPRVAIVDDVSNLSPGGSAAVIAAPDAPIQPAGADTDDTVQAEVSPHPVTRNLETGLRLPMVRVASSPPPDWTPVVRFGERVAVAVRDEPARQVWVGFDSPDWPRRPEYVVFWTNVFDWLGGSAGSEYRGYPIAPLGRGWRRVAGDDVSAGAEPGLWPGLYERAEDGARRAVNAAYVPISLPAAVPDWSKKLAAALTRTQRGRPLAATLLLAAVACLALSALLWTGRRRRSWSVP
jgi:hypothetical protein